MNNNTFSTSTLINDDNISSFYNDYYPSLLPHIDHHHQFLQPSPFSQFESLPDCVPLDSFLPQNNGHEDYNQTIPHNPPSLLPLNNTIGDQPTEPSQTITNIEDSQRISTSQDPKMKRTKKPTRTDRHSKIKTAKGIRDRRMRLSLDVAKELFGLQDMLGFDKASKTVEWLLTQAKPEIIKIATTLSQQCGFSSDDESHTRPALGSMETSSDLCEIASMWMADDRSSNTNTTETMGNKVDGRSMRRKRKKLEPRTPILKKMSKDERAKARERAKHRTIEKMEMKRRSELVEVVDEEVHGLGEILKNNNIRDVNPSSFGMTHYKELCKNNGFAVGNDFVMNKKNHISNESYGINNKLSSSFPMVNQHHSQGAPNPIEQYQFTDLDHFLGKSSDISYNYLNMR